jgi:hypothetical protein
MEFWLGASTGLGVGAAEGVGVGLADGVGLLGGAGAIVGRGLAELEADGDGLGEGLTDGLGDGVGGVVFAGLLITTAANVIVSVCVAVAFEASVIVIVMVKVPSTVGVPEIVEPLSDSPAGKVPAVQVYGLVPPLPVSECVNAVPLVPLAVFAEVIVGLLAAIVMVSV